VVYQLQQAKRAFSMQARGPACERYLEQLEQECEQLWKNGRQMCEEISLTGNHCVNEVSRPTFNAVHRQMSYPVAESGWTFTQ